MSRSSVPLAIAIAAAISAGCGESAAPARGEVPAASAATAPAPAPAPAAAAVPAGITEASRAEAKSIFSMRCATCHGPEGAGDGPGSAGLTPKPRNLQDRSWQASVTDDHVEKIIRYGGAAVGKSPAMPANPDLLAKNDVVAALREHVRSLPR